MICNQLSRAVQRLKINLKQQIRFTPYNFEDLNKIENVASFLLPLFVSKSNIYFKNFV